MLNAHIPAVKQQALIGLCMFVGGLWLAWQVGGNIVAGDFSTLEYGGLAVLGCAAAFVILRSWRTGFYLFLVWLLFEDLPRKYMGNGPALFFGKDILAALTYVSLYAAIRKGREKTFRPSFLLPLAIFVWLGAIQIFNSNSPHVFYGLLGFKIYFFYLPMIWVGYALIRNDEDLRKFLMVNALTAAVIGGIGIIQGVVGNGFLNPAVMSPEIARLGNLDKVSPISGHVFNLPVSVFVSTGRYANYLTLVFPLLLGGVAYLILHRLPGRKIVFGAIGIVGAAALLSGGRGCVVTTVGMTFILTIGLL